MQLRLLLRGQQLGSAAGRGSPARAAPINPSQAALSTRLSDTPEGTDNQSCKAVAQELVRTELHSWISRVAGSARWLPGAGKGTRCATGRRRQIHFLLFFNVRLLISTGF